MRWFQWDNDSGRRCEESGEEYAQRAKDEGTRRENQRGSGCNDWASTMRVSRFGLSVFAFSMYIHKRARSKEEEEIRADLFLLFSTIVKRHSWPSTLFAWHREKFLQNHALLRTATIGYALPCSWEERTWVWRGNNSPGIGSTVQLESISGLAVLRDLKLQFTMLSILENQYCLCCCPSLQKDIVIKKQRIIFDHRDYLKDFI